MNKIMMSKIVKPKKMKMNKLKNWFRPTNQIFRIFKKDTIDYWDLDRRRIFIDRNSKILMVAHTDTVLKSRYYGRYNNRIYATGLDDRIGCYLSWMLSSQYKTDLLLTDNEEIAGSTGEYHNLKDYNWIVEFDRRGEDAVLYSMGSTEWRKALKQYFDIGFGSFSDIVSLNTKACCVNIGTGVYFEHFEHSYIDLSITSRQIARFRNFYKKYKDKKFIRDKNFTHYRRGLYGGYYLRSNMSTKTPKLKQCELCEEWFLKNKMQATYINGEIIWLCDDCYQIMRGDLEDSEFDEDDAFIKCENCGAAFNKYYLNGRPQVMCPYCHHFNEGTNYQQDILI